MLMFIKNNDFSDVYLYIVIALRMFNVHHTVIVQLKGLFQH